MAYLELSREGVLPTVENMVDENNYVTVDFLFPNGILIPQSVNYLSSLDQIKSIVWREVHNYPLSDSLKSEDWYSFFFINKLGEKEEVLDGSQSLKELQPFLALFQIVKSKGDSGSKTLDRNINCLVGKGIQKQESFPMTEINDFKKKMTEMCFDITTHRRSQTTMEKFQWRYPLRLRSANDSSIPNRLEEKMKNGFIDNERIVVDVTYKDSGLSEKLPINYHDSPQDVIAKVVDKTAEKTSRNREDPTLYILKVIGEEEYVYGEHHLIQFKYVYQCLVKSMAPQFWLVRKDSLPEAAPPIPKRPSNIGNQSLSSPSAGGGDSLHRSPHSIIVWNIETYYRVQIQGISKVQLADGSKIKLYVGLYHGSESLCKEIATEELIVQGGSCYKKIDIEFDINVADLPHTSRLCFALYTFGNNMKRKDLADWVNVPVYDFKRRLQRGDRELPMWKEDLLQQPEEYCYPLGGVSLNTQTLDTSFIKVHFPDVLNNNSKNAYLIYPAHDKVLECASQNMEKDGSAGHPSMKASKTYIDQLYQALHNSEQLYEQDKELIWMLRHEVCDRYPNYLAKVLQSVKWNNYVDVAKMTALLQAWPTLPMDYALELLSFEFPDTYVREFAVKCLDDMLSDDDLYQLFLQLVQALKFETYLYCPLAKFLLKRALHNRNLGHRLFWLLRSECYNPKVSTQYSLILECYLRHNLDHLVELLRQQEALKKLAGVNLLIKSEKKKMSDQANRKEAENYLREVLNQQSFKNCLSGLSSPLSPVFKMQDLRVDDCKFMNSKKRPLWLIWSNEDHLGADIKIIYKNGDDLRQDMLTLQILSMMDNIWQAEGIDFRMNPYLCMATDYQQGMIEIVDPASTLSSIQKKYKKRTFDKKALFEWLKKKHNTDESLNVAVEEFLYSCAGYCVATYVLGIGDRHNDNIMMKDSGQMFHIDFGHFLGNFKSKFNIKRERVPFVLTSHFVYVITKGDTKQENFARFQELCEKAYLILRTRYSLFVSLFMMMLSGGIPQLSSPKDVSYLQETLVPHLSEEKALAHFRSKFIEAMKGSWTTSVNWWFHNKAQ